jgi:glycosyltransferase involved in cell wall biosynthesis
MRPIRVAHVLNTIGLGGVPEAALHLMRSLACAPFDLRVFVMKRSDGEPDARSERRARFEELGIPITFADAAPEKLAVASDLCRWLDAERIDIVHTHSYKPNLYARLAALPCRASGVKLVAHYHNEYDNKWGKDGTLVLDRRLAGSSDALVAVSAAVQDHVASRLGIARDRIDVVPNGVEVERFAAGEHASARAALGLPATGPVVGVVGRISEQKGQEDFIRAAVPIAAAIPEAVFLVVGSADDERLHASLRRLVHDLVLDDRVRFTGHVTDMPALYAALDLLVAPSRWEGFGLMLVEGMAAGRPIVATAVGAIPEVVGLSGAAVLVPPADEVALAKAVTPLLLDPVRRAAMGAAGRRRANDFSWDVSGQRLATVYERILAR